MAQAPIGRRAPFLRADAMRLGARLAFAEMIREEVRELGLRLMTGPIYFDASSDGDAPDGIPRD